MQQTKTEMLAGAVWVWIPRAEQGIVSTSAQALLYEAQPLAARLNTHVVAFITEAPNAALINTLGEWGVKGVVVPDHFPLPHPLYASGESVLSAWHHQPAQLPLPAVVLFVADAFGLIAAPLLAAQLSMPYVSHVTSLTAHQNQLVAARLMYGEQYEAIVEIAQADGMIATLASSAIGEVSVPAKSSISSNSQFNPSKSSPIVWAADDTSFNPPQHQVDEATIQAETSPILPPDISRLALSDAERIVAFGRGAFSQPAIKLVEELATALNAVVGGTRPAADERWLPFSKQIGLTGVVVQPVLYIAVGISGAPYHMVGVKEPQTMIAINQDSEAPIFSYAQLGIVGDLFAILPTLISALQQEPHGSKSSKMIEQAFHTASQEQGAQIKT